MTLPRPPRWFTADDILANRVNLDAYPFRYIYLTVAPASGLSAALSGGTGHATRVDTVFTAVELLETRGWELVNFDQGGSVAYLRRKAR